MQLFFRLLSSSPRSSEIVVEMKNKRKKPANRPLAEALGLQSSPPAQRLQPQASCTMAFLKYQKAQRVGVLDFAQRLHVGDNDDTLLPRRLFSRFQKRTPPELLHQPRA